jgi:SAM-dependent methyltransferase
MNQPTDHPLIARGRRRFQLFTNAVQQFTGARPKGRLLDFGCGAGGFLQAALDAGMDAHGVEVEADRQAQFHSSAPASRHDRLKLYDGGLLPFGSRSFDLVYSWFVFEHVQQPMLSLREIVRVTRPGGTIHLYADDARNHWDGHVGIPLPAFMPRQFTRAYLEVFGLEERAEFINDTVVYVTAPTVTSVLQTLGCEILHQNTADPSREIPAAADIASDDDARQVAREVKARLDRGLVPPPAENLHVVGRRVR